MLPLHRTWVHFPAHTWRLKIRTPVPGGLVFSSDLHGHQACMWYKYIHTGKTLIKKIFFFKKKERSNLRQTAHIREVSGQGTRSVRGGSHSGDLENLDVCPAGGAHSPLRVSSSFVHKSQPWTGPGLRTVCTVCVKSVGLAGRNYLPYLSTKDKRPS